MKHYAIKKVNSRLPSRIKVGWALKEKFSEKHEKFPIQNANFIRFLYSTNLNIELKGNRFFKGCLYGLSNHQFVNLIDVLGDDSFNIKPNLHTLRFNELFDVSFSYKGYMQFLPRAFYDEPARIFFSLLKLDSRTSKIDFIQRHPFMNEQVIDPNHFSKFNPNPYDYLSFFYIRHGLIGSDIDEETAMERILFQEINHLILNFNNRHLDLTTNQYVYSPPHQFDQLFETQKQLLSKILISDERYSASIENVRVLISKTGSECLFELSNVSYETITVSIIGHNIKKIITYNESIVVNQEITLEGFGYIVIQLEHFFGEEMNFYEAR